MKKSAIIGLFSILILIWTLTIPKFYSFIGINLIELGVIGMNTTSFILPTTLLIYALYRSKLGQISKFPIVIISILSIFIILSFYKNFVTLGISLTSILIFVISFLIWKSKGKDKEQYFF